jgi:6-phosphogluconate dehydrogenase
MNISNANKAIIIMGVSGSGKTTIGQLLAQKTQLPFFDGDDFHSKANIDKMASGNPLNDEDRKEWLMSLNQLIQENITQKGCIVACSGLKKSYRDMLSFSISNAVRFVFLEGSYEVILSRMEARKNHFIPPSLLQSQFETLEIPQNAFSISIMQTPETIVDSIHNEVFNTSEIGLIGLGVMGKSLSINIVSKGFSLSMYNRQVPNVEEDIAKNFKNEHEALADTLAFDTLAHFVASLQSPKKIILMIPAGTATDQMIQELAPLLSPNDCIIDAGNAFYQDTNTRMKELATHGIHLIGCGISGGEEGALHGPSLMPSGSLEGYEIVAPILTAIAAKDAEGNPCCTYIGKEGSGHFVKMVHNGIEYAEMQLLSEIYSIGVASGKNPEEIANQLSAWKHQQVGSYLLDITIAILNEKEQNKWVIDTILDKAESKGTGNWTTVEMTKDGIPATMIASALFARYLSSFKGMRTKMSSLYSLKSNSNTAEEFNWEVIRTGYELARIINHFQGFWLIQGISEKYNWDINLSEVARIWTNGCIIRSQLMQEIVPLLKEEKNLLFSKNLFPKIIKLKPALSSVVAKAIQAGIAVPCLGESINFLNGLTTDQSGANLIQAQRDYFGAHTFQRIDAESDQFFHHQWIK